MLLFEVGSQKPFEVARVCREDLALPLVLRQPFRAVGPSLTIDCKITVGDAKFATNRVSIQ